MVRLGHRGPARADLVSVDAMHEGRHDRQATQQDFRFAVAQPLRMSQPGEVGFHLLQLRNAARRSDNEYEQGATLPALGVADEVGALPCGLGECFYVTDHVVGRRDLLAEVVPDYLLQRRNGRIVLGAGDQLLSRGGYLESGEQREGAEHQQFRGSFGEGRDG